MPIGALFAQHGLFEGTYAVRTLLMLFNLVFSVTLGDQDHESNRIPMVRMCKYNFMIYIQL